MTKRISNLRDTWLDNLEQDKIFQKFLKTLREKNLLQNNSSVLIAVSGGLDSSVLAYLFARASRVLSCNIYIAHVDHGVRGAASSREASWIKVLGARLNIPVHCLKLELENEQVSQAVLRKERRKLLTQLAESLGVQKIATAHHADDNAETLLMRMIAGTGPQGLRAMAPLEGIWIKPLLTLTREELLNYAREQKLAWVEDPSNAQQKYLRNRIRHEALPLLEEIRPAAKRNMSNLAQRICFEEDELEEWLSAHIPSVPRRLSDDWLMNWPQSLRRRILKIWIKRLNIPHNPDLIESINQGKEVVLPQGSFLRQEQQWVFTPETEFSKLWERTLPVELGRRLFLGRSLAWSFLAEAPETFQCYDYSIYLRLKQPQAARNKRLCLDWELMPPELAIRALHYEDAPELRKKLEHLKVPLPYQKNWPVLVNAANPIEIIALIGVEVLEAYRYQRVGRCVAIESFYEEALPATVPHDNLNG